MKKTILTTVLLVLFMVLGTGFTYARQGGRGYGNGGGNCPYRSTVNNTNTDQSQTGWYCPRTGTYTNVRNHYGPIRSNNSRGSGWRNSGQSPANNQNN